jgi:glycosyltransferase involved in cell wall biosynthesis/predicted LPLAT superfamily acyltransferase
MEAAVSVSTIRHRPPVPGTPPLVVWSDVGKTLMMAPLAVLAWVVPVKWWDCIGTLLADLETGDFGRRRRRSTSGGPAGWAADSIKLTSPEGFWHSRTIAVADCLGVLRSYRPGGWRPQIAIFGEEHVTDALEAGRGAILWDAQFGGHNLITKMALATSGWPPVQLSLPSHGFSDSRFGVRFLNPIRTRVENRYLAERVLLEEADTGASTVVGAMRSVVQRLRSNALVTITAFEGVNAQRLVTTPFLGSSISLPTGPVSLAAISGAPLLPVFTLRTGPGRYEVHIEPALEVQSRARRQDPSAAIESYVHLLEGYVKRNPSLWMGWWGIALNRARMDERNAQGTVEAGASEKLADRGDPLERGRRAEQTPAVANRQPLRIFVAVNSFVPGGMQQYVTDLCIALRESGAVIDVFTGTPRTKCRQEIAALRNAGITVHQPSRLMSLAAAAYFNPVGESIVGVPERVDSPGSGMAQRVRDLLTPIRGLLRSCWRTRLSRQMTRSAAQSNPDVLHVHGSQLSWSWVARWGQEHNVPTVFSEHSTLDEMGGPARSDAPRWLNCVDVVTCWSERARRPLLQLRSHAEERVLVHHHIIGRDLASTVHQSTDTQGNTLVILCAARLDAKKGLKTLIEAFSEIARTRPSIQLVLAGDGDQRQELEELAGDLGLTARIEFAGWLTHGLFLTRLGAADVFVLPSLSEGMPVSVMEAMDAGKAIVATRVGGIPELVQHGVEGLLVEPGDAAALATALSAVLDDENLRGRLALAAKLKILAQGFGPEVAAMDMRAIYTQAGVLHRDRERFVDATVAAPLVVGTGQQ